MESTFTTVSVSQLAQMGQLAQACKGSPFGWARKKGKLMPVMSESKVLPVAKTTCYVLSVCALEMKTLDKY